MSFQYTFSKEPLKLGDYDKQYGQTFWAEVNEHLQPVKFNIMSDRKLDLEDAIECEERVERKTAKGKDYYQLKKVKVTEAYSGDADPELVPEATGATPPGHQNTAALAITGPMKNQLDRIEKQQTIIIEKLNLLLGPEEGE